MLKDFILAVAMLCPHDNSVLVTDVLTVKPITQRECEAYMDDKAFRSQFQVHVGKKGCVKDLLCTRVYWKEEVDYDYKYDPNVPDGFRRHDTK